MTAQPDPRPTVPTSAGRSLRLGSMKEQFDVTTRDGWLNEFALQLRLRDADGATVGNAIAEAESHVADSGETLLEAFGQPRDYAASVPVTPRTSLGREALHIFAVAASAYIGTALLFNGIFHWGSDAVLSGGELAGFVSGAAMSLLLLVGAKSIIGRFRFWGLFAWYVVAFALAFVPGQLWRDPVVHLPAGVAVAAGVMGLLVMVWLLRRTIGDPVRDPRQPAADPNLDADERALVADGRPVAAIKHHRQRTGSTLREAKGAVDRAASAVEDRGAEPAGH